MIFRRSTLSDRRNEGMSRPVSKSPGGMEMERGMLRFWTESQQTRMTHRIAAYLSGKDAGV
ncbi:MAG TPA: hypothetical protein DD982_11605 [Thalassospira sp.]|nr:hypothetical protein [Thalassospira sp.]HBS23160.1 hypothetical protein [Thalassospira sp.]